MPRESEFIPTVDAAGIGLIGRIVLDTKTRLA